MVLVKRLILRSQLHQKKVSIKRGTGIRKSKTYKKWKALFPDNLQIPTFDICK